MSPDTCTFLMERWPWRGLMGKLFLAHRLLPKGLALSASCRGPHLKTFSGYGQM